MERGSEPFALVEVGLPAPVSAQGRGRGALLLPRLSPGVLAVTRRLSLFVTRVSVSSQGKGSKALGNHVLKWSLDADREPSVVAPCMDGVGGRGEGEALHLISQGFTPLLTLLAGNNLCRM